ncbi:rhomboid family intramembrane serine protease [Bacillus tuaregi]|uniref:rhomboid family intramembrane serine protease n=1 Tax=Bacillus tuaregi TaxID=1816695 RepID=UPI0008F91711|nr:rhomboid family intramembrane serine protease [Bacillus tuaregi]
MFTRTESFREFIRYYPVVSVIVSIHIILYLLTSLPIFPNLMLLEQFSGVNLYIWQGEIWRLLTPIFLHSGFSHVLFNSFSLVLFGPALERILGSIRFTWIYLITGISANVATLLIEPVTYIHLGASGAIFGLFGMYISMNIFHKHLLSRDNRQLITTIAVISIIMTFFQPNINVIAHLFGFLSGFLIGALILRKNA